MNIEAVGQTRSGPMGEAAYQAILSKLLSLEIAPEERISVDGLCRQLGISQTPLRQALTRLEAQGLVTKTHLVGYRAAPEMNRAQFDQFYETRMLLEPHVTEKAADQMSEEELDRLEEFAREYLTDRLDDADRLVNVMNADTEFHRLIANSSGNHVIAGILENIRVQIQFTLFRHSRRFVSVRSAGAEHLDILSALRKRDGVQAANLMRDHLAASRSRYWPE